MYYNESGEAKAVHIIKVQCLSVNMFVRVYSYAWSEPSSASILFECDSEVCTGIFVAYGIIKPSSKSLVLLLWIFYVFLSLVFDMPLCASVYMCLVVTCWERADLLALVCGV